MKRLLVTLLVIIIAVPLVLFGFLYYSYNSVGEEVVPEVTIDVLGTGVKPDGYEWHTPVFGGIVTKDLYLRGTCEATDCGSLTSENLELEAPEGYTTNATLAIGDTQVWSGGAGDIEGYTFLDSGRYTLTLTCEKQPEQGKGYGVLNFAATFTVVAQPRIQLSAEGIGQGDVMAIGVYNLPEGVVPTAESEVGAVTFIPVATPGSDESLGVRTMAGYLPVAYNRAPGSYTVIVRAGEHRWDVTFTVVETAFPRQDLEIDVWDPVISEANSWWAYQEFNNTIPPFYYTTDENKYWQGAFIEPATGDINTEYGLFRYTNGEPDPSRHDGIDIDGEIGNPVVAPAAGKVVYAGTLLNTGNTLVIEHGGGLKSYFYHMDSLAVGVDAMVAQGDALGAVGTTGYSTGAHLHYEVRIGDQSIDPMLLFSGEGGLLYFE